MRSNFGGGDSFLVNASAVSTLFQSSLCLPCLSPVLDDVLPCHSWSIPSATKHSPARTLRLISPPFGSSSRTRPYAASFFWSGLITTRNACLSSQPAPCASIVLYSGFIRSSPSTSSQRKIREPLPPTYTLGMF